MCNLGVASAVHQAIAPYLDEWAKENPGCAVLAYTEGGDEQGDLRVCMTKTFELAAKKQSRLSAAERRGSIIVELSGLVLML